MRPITVVVLIWALLVMLAGFFAGCAQAPVEYEINPIPTPRPRVSYALTW